MSEAGHTVSPLHPRHCRARIEMPGGQKCPLKYRGTKRLVSVNICSVECNSAGIFVSKVSPGIFVVKEKLMPVIFGSVKLPFWVR